MIKQIEIFTGFDGGSGLFWLDICVEFTLNVLRQFLAGGVVGRIEDLTAVNAAAAGELVLMNAYQHRTRVETGEIQTVVHVADFLASDGSVFVVIESLVGVACHYHRQTGIGEHIAQLENKSEEEVIRIHSQSDYFVYMLGFAPGHPYTARFENPFSFKRMENPRLKIPSGSIVVQLALSDIIPFDQPCGWNIIGSTPVLACDYRKENPFLLKAGQWIHHTPVSREEYLDIKKQVEAGTYVCRTWEKED